MSRFSRPVLLLAFALFAATAALRAADAAKPRVAVLEFKNKAEGYGWSGYKAGQAAQDMLVTELVKKGGYRVMEREQLEAILQEKNLSLSGDIDPKTAVKLGKMIGVEYLIAGAVTELGVADRNINVPELLRRAGAVGERPKPEDGRGRGCAGVLDDDRRDRVGRHRERVHVRLERVRRGRGRRRRRPRQARPDPAARRRQARRVARPDEDLDERARRHVATPPASSARSRRSCGSTLYVNVGSEAGVKEGDEFTVIRAGEVIKDPDTGEVLGANESTVGRVRITAVMGPRLSKAAAVSGTVYKVGDVLKK